MSDLDIVDEEDNVIGKADYERIHNEGLRHRSVHIFLFKEPGLETLLVSKRSSRLKFSPSRLHMSAGGHVKSGQSYPDAALDELREGLFYEMTELPSGIILVEMGRYKNDSRPENKEIATLFYTVYEGTFLPDPHEIESVYWQNRHDVWRNMQSNPQRYTKTFPNAMREFRRFSGEAIKDAI